MKTRKKGDYSLAPRKPPSFWALHVRALSLSLPQTNILFVLKYGRQFYLSNTETKFLNILKYLLIAFVIKDVFYDCLFLYRFPTYCVLPRSKLTEESDTLVLARQHGHCIIPLFGGLIFPSHVLMNKLC